FVEYAKAAPTDLLIEISICNRGPDQSEINVLPTFWFRNFWTWWPEETKPSLRDASRSGGATIIAASDAVLGAYFLYCDRHPRLLFTENETNNERLFGTANPTPYVKDGINNYVVAGRQNATNPNNTGTKAAAHYQLRVGAGASATIRLRLNQVAPGESRGGVSPPRAPGSVREPLGSYGSRCSAVGIQEAPVGKQRRIGTDDPSQPSPCPRGTRSQSLVFVA